MHQKKIYCDPCFKTIIYSVPPPFPLLVAESFCHRWMGTHKLQYILLYSLL